MPGTAVLLQSSDKDLKSCTWTYREKKVKLSATCLLAGHVAYSVWQGTVLQTEKSGSKATLFLPSGEQYRGSWQHNKREGEQADSSWFCLPEVHNDFDRQPVVKCR